jgi:hypothetical protein
MAMRLTAKLLKKANTMDEAQVVKLLERAIAKGSIKSVANLAYKIDNDLGYGCCEIWESVSDEAKENFGDLLLAQGEELGRCIKNTTYGGIPWLIAPSTLDPGNTKWANQWLKFPNRAFITAPLVVAVDEYFGMCYHREREHERFQPGIKEVLISRIKAAYPDPNAIMQAATKEEVVSSGLAVANADDLILIYGREPLEQWWANVDFPAFKAKFMYDVDYLEETLDNAFNPGGHQAELPDFEDFDGQ